MRRAISVFVACLLFAQTAFARSYLRDAEIEHTLRQMTDPILTSAGIEPSAVRIFLINDPSINAFVAGGQNIFFHTGLLLQVNSPAMLMGVIAHETGHISGAHLTQLAAASDEASIGVLLSAILGAAVVASGNGQAGAAIISSGQNTMMRNLLSHYRGNEQQADQAGIKYLRTIGLSPQGMLDTFELLRRKERQQVDPSNVDPYLLTHPLTTDRIAALRSATSLAGDLPPQPNEPLKTNFARTQAKLRAFLQPPEETLRRIATSDTSQAAHLARAVAYFKKPNLEAALGEMKALIALSPNNGFNYDLLGQILFENGRIAPAIAAYEKANQLQPKNALILTDLGKSYLTQERVKDAILVLEEAAHQNHAMSSTQRQLAIAYGKQGKQGQSYLALAREAALQNDPEEMLRYGKQAKELLAGNAVLLLQAEDLIADAKRLNELKD